MEIKQRVKKITFYGEKHKNNFEHNSRSKIILQYEYKKSLENSHIFRKTILLAMAVFLDQWTCRMLSTISKKKQYGLRICEVSELKQIKPRKTRGE
jgi:hypothetical protein